MTEVCALCFEPLYGKHLASQCRMTIRQQAARKVQHAIYKRLATMPCSEAADHVRSIDVLEVLQMPLSMD